MSEDEVMRIRAFKGWMSEYGMEKLQLMSKRVMPKGTWELNDTLRPCFPPVLTTVKKTD